MNSKRVIYNNDPSPFAGGSYRYGIVKVIDGPNKNKFFITDLITLNTVREWWVGPWETSRGLRRGQFFDPQTSEDVSDQVIRPGIILYSIKNRPRGKR